MPAAVKFLPFSENYLKKAVKREIRAMEAVKDSDHNATLLRDGTVKRDNVCYRYIVMR